MNLTYEVCRYIFIGGAILAGIMLVVSVLLFILLKIPTVIGDLTGRNARKAIESIRKQNEDSGEKVYRSSNVNKARGKITEKMTHSGKIINKHDSSGGAMATEKISDLGLADSTTVLDGMAGETAVIDRESGKTELLDHVYEDPVGFEFAVEYEITYIFTDESIV